MNSHIAFGQLRRDLIALRDDLVELQDIVGQNVSAEPGWRARLIRNVLPAVDFDLPVLLVAITGGGSTGKSSLFNALADAPLSQVAFRAGLTRRVLLAGHPDVLSGPQVAEALLHRLPQAPEPWTQAQDTTQPGPPLFATSEQIPRNLLLIDTPDFDTGERGERLNRQLAEPVLRTAEVLIYLFTNAVYNNLSNTEFMADIVGGIGGRPTVLVYRISRAADEETVLEHCRHVAQRLYENGEPGADGWPPQVIGVYRLHESDRVALGREQPRPLPVGKLTAGRNLPDLLAGLDVATIKRQVFASDLAAIAMGSRDALDEVKEEISRAALYRQALDRLVTQHALEALRSFPANEAITLAARLFIESSPPAVRVLRQTGRVVGAPFRAARTTARWAGEWLGWREPQADPPNLEDALRDDLLRAASELRNQLIEPDLILRVSSGDALLDAARAAPDPRPTIEPLGRDLYHVHVAAPDVVRQQRDALLGQDWNHTQETLEKTAQGLVGLPEDIEAELRGSVAAFRAGMGWQEQLREVFFASLTALPPVLGVSYTLLTANPAVGAGLWIELEGLFGLNDLWALVSIPASAGLSEQDRRQLEQMITPVFKVWLARRTETIAKAYREVIFAPLWQELETLPSANDPRLQTVEAAVERLQGEHDA